MAAATNNIQNNGPEGYMWHLNPPGHSAELRQRLVIGDREKREWVFGNDHRTPVVPKNYSEGHKFRSVVKLFMGFEGDRETEYMASGYLVSPNTLVTAGHCVYDRDRRASWMKCYIGYCGAESEPTSSTDGGPTQYRIAEKVIVPAQWLDEKQDYRDVAFVKVDPPFCGSLCTFTTANLSGAFQEVRVGVVGYPGDKSSNPSPNRDGARPEFGAEMWQDFQVINYDPDNSSYNRSLEYRNISTTHGQSGSPVIREEDGVVIGTHHGRTHDRMTNCASIFNRDHGVDFPRFHEALAANVTPPYIRELPLSTPLLNLQHLNTVLECAITAHEQRENSEALLNEYLCGELSAICSITLSYLNAHRASPPVVDQLPGVSERAVLAEAAFQCFVRFKDDNKRNDVKRCMFKKYRDFGFTMDQASRLDLGATLINILVDASKLIPKPEDTTKGATTKGGTTKGSKKLREIIASLGLDTQANESHLDRLDTPLERNRVPLSTSPYSNGAHGTLLPDTSVTDNIFFNIASYIKTGRLREALTLSSLRTGDSNPTLSAFKEDAQAALSMTIRAVLAECVLQVMLTKPLNWWQDTRIWAGDDKSDTVLDGFVKRVEKIGPVVQDIVIVNDGRGWKVQQTSGTYENGFQD